MRCEKCSDILKIEFAKEIYESEYPVIVCLECYEDKAEESFEHDFNEALSYSPDQINAVVYASILNNIRVSKGFIIAEKLVN